MVAHAIRNILFDLGNVLIHCDLDFAAQQIAMQSKSTAAEIKAQLQEHPLLDEFDAGRHSGQGFSEQINALFGWQGTSQELEAIWNGMLTADEAMFEYMRSLERRNFRTYILSNINPYHIEHVRQTYPQVLSTAGQIFSCECLMVKPNEAIFHHTRDTLGIVPEETVFIDDRPQNIAAAQKIGFYGIVHVSLADTRHQLERMLAQ